MRLVTKRAFTPVAASGVDSAPVIISAFPSGIRRLFPARVFRAAWLLAVLVMEAGVANAAPESSAPVEAEKSGKGKTDETPFIDPRVMELLERMNPQRTFEAGGNRVQFVPVPVFDLDPNEGPTAGAMGIFLVQRRTTNAIIGIISPQYTWNGIIGHTGTLDYQGYFRPGSKVRLYGSIAERVYREAMFELDQNPIFGTPFFASLRASYINDPYRRFYGTGAGTPASGQSAFTMEDYHAGGRVGVKVLGAFNLVYEGEVYRTRIKPDVIPGVPSTLAVYPGLPGTPKSLTVVHRTAVEMDTRPDGEFSRVGTFMRMYGYRSSESFGSDVGYWGWGGEALHLRPFSERVYGVVRGLVDHVYGSSAIPFMRLPALGGDSALRGFGGGRFYDNGRLLFQAEVRVALVRLNWFDVESEVRLDPFFEMGRVFHSSGDLGFKDMEYTGGVGWRLEVRPDILVRVDFGFSRDGMVAFVKMGYPF